MNFSGGQKFAGVVDVLVSLINMAIPVLAGLAVAIFFWGVVRYIYHEGDPHSKSQDKTIMMWGIIALFVLFSLWGILRLLSDSFGITTPTERPGGFPGNTELLL